MNRELALHVFERARTECALAPRVARALGVSAKQAATLADEPRPSFEHGMVGYAQGYGTLRSLHHQSVAEEITREQAFAPELQSFRRVFGVAVGKGAAAMAWGAGKVTAGLVVTPHAPIRMPPGWTHVPAAHPDPDATSEAAARQVRALVEDANDHDVVLALVSGGASAMLEEPRLPLAELRAIARALMAGGAPIEDLNVVRSALSAIKGGQLALDCGARIVTLVASDIVDDDVAIVGSGPTIGPWLDSAPAPADYGAFAEARRLHAIEILARHGLPSDALAAPIASRVVTRSDRVEVVSRMRDFADAFARGLRHERARAGRTPPAELVVVDEPMRGDVEAIADRIAFTRGPTLMWGEPTLKVPADHGHGGRMQQLALELARRLAGSRRTALAIGTDGMDGPPVASGEPGLDLPWAAGGFVDGTTWGTIVAAGIDPERALARCDARRALEASGAIVYRGPTGVNHADLVVVV